MAERRRSKDKPDLTPDAAAPPPGQPPDTIPIQGILGESGSAASVRLYLDRGVSTYYDIPVEGIAAREKVPAERSPLGVDSTLLFVRRGVQLVVHRVDTRSVEEEFVAGDFTAPGTFTATPAVPAPAGTGLTPVITPLLFASLGIACTILTPGCPGGPPGPLTTVVSAFGCPPASALDRCPTVRNCPTYPQGGAKG